MRNSHLLLRNERHRATIMPAGMKANGNFSDTGVQRFSSDRINRMMRPSDAADLGRPCKSSKSISISSGSPIRFRSGAILSKYSVI